MHQDGNLQANQEFQLSNWRWKRSWKSIWTQVPANQYIDKLNVLQKIYRFPDESNAIELNWDMRTISLIRNISCIPHKLKSVF